MSYIVKEYFVCFFFVIFYDLVIDSLLFIIEFYFGRVKVIN